MLTEGKVGEIRAAFKILKNVSAVAKLLRVDPKTVSKYKAAKFKHQPAKQRQRSHTIKQRIEVVRKLAEATCSKGGRKFPKFGSASEIRAGLNQKTGVVVKNFSDVSGGLGGLRNSLELSFSLTEKKKGETYSSASVPGLIQSPHNSDAALGFDVCFITIFDGVTSLTLNTNDHCSA